MSYKNNQPVSVHNKMDVPNRIYYADPTRSDSDVYGDLRDSREGRGLLGDNSMFIDSPLPASDLYTLNEFCIEATIDVLSRTGVNSAIYGYRSSSIELFQMSYSDGGGTNAITLLLRDSDNILYTLTGTSFSILMGNTVKVKGEIVNIQTSTPTINLYENDIIVDTITYTKGVNLRSSRALIGGIATNTTPGSSAVRLYLNTLYNFTQYINSVRTIFHNFEEEAGLTAIDSFGNFNNGTFINSSPANFVTDNSVGISYANTHGHTISDGATYYYNNDDTGLIPINVIIPRDESNTNKCCAYLLGGAQADLQYKGKVPYQHHVTNSPCFKGVTGSYMTLDVLTTDIITAHESSSVPTCTVDGRLDFVDGELYYDVTITRTGVKVARLALTEKPGNGTYFDIGVVGGVPTNNDTTLVNGSPSNQGYQTDFCWLQNGISKAFTPVEGFPAFIPPDNSFSEPTIEIYFRSTKTNGTFIINTTVENPSGDFSIIAQPGSTALALSSNVSNLYVDDILQSETITRQDFLALVASGWHTVKYSYDAGVVINLSFFNRTNFLFSGIVKYIKITDGITAITYEYCGDVNIPSTEALNNTGVYDDVLDIPQTGADFLNTEETLTLDPTPETVQADAANNVYFDGNGDPIDQTFASMTTNNLVNNQYFNDLSVPNKVRQIRFHKDNLTVEQINTDKRITNN